ncbi:MAG TPA: amidase [Acidimicrobiales bacterium]
MVDAFRAGERSPSEELEATLAAIDASALNAWGHLAVDTARAAAANAETSLPFGGVPIGVKELDSVMGWPDTHASVPLADQVATHTKTMVHRLQAAGTVLVGQTTASEFGGVNVTRTVLHGATRNPWDVTKTPGGSSGGSASAVAGGHVTLATAGDGGGSIRIPAGFAGLVGLKATYGRIPKGPRVEYGNMTTTIGCVSRSVRDTARWFDVTAGHDARDPMSLPRYDGSWERGLGRHLDALRGRRVAVVADWGGAVCSPAMWEQLELEAAALVADAGLRRIERVDTSLPNMGAAWSISGMIAIHAQLADHWPDCADQLTPEIRFGLESTAGRYSMEARIRIERRRMELNERMSAIFDEVDLVITASNPDVAFAAEGPLPDTFGGVRAGAGNNGKLTFPANLHGNPAISFPAGTLDGLPISLQVVGRHFDEELLLDLAWLAERQRPWPLVAPGSPV